MIPERRIALQEFQVVANITPGPWKNHSLNVALAAENIAKECKDLDKDKAYVLGN